MGLIKVTTGWHYDSWYQKQVACSRCGRVEQYSDMAQIEVDDFNRHYCFDCAYEVIDSERAICPACRNYHYNQNTPFCNTCRKLETAKHIATQVNSQLNRTRDPRDNLTILEWFDTLRHYGFRCIYCRDVYTDLDHYIPVSRGGLTTVDNCVPACGDCNSSKLAKMPREILLHDNAAEIEAYLKRRGERFVMRQAINQMAVNQQNEVYYTLGGM